MIGTHSGSQAVYRALAIAAKALDPEHVPDLTNTAPTDPIGATKDELFKAKGRGLIE